jgi:putative oxidoreductase
MEAGSTAMHDDPASIREARVDRSRWMLRLLRTAAASLLLIHGATRLTTGGVPGFGAFLESVGLPLGLAFAILLTAVEIAGTLLLIAGQAVVPVALWLAAEIATGIVLVHARNGWFVVGGGSGGVEYSVLLVVVFLVIAGTDDLMRNPPGAGRKPDAFPASPLSSQSEPSGETHLSLSAAFVE